MASPGAELAAARTRGEVSVSILLGDALHTPLHPYLLAGAGPVKSQRGPRIFRKFAGLATAQVRVEDEAARIGLLQEHEAHGGPPLTIGAGQRDALGGKHLALGGACEAFL